MTAINMRRKLERKLSAENGARVSSADRRFDSSSSKASRTEPQNKHVRSSTTSLFIPNDLLTKKKSCQNPNMPQELQRRSYFSN